MTNKKTSHEASPQPGVALTTDSLNLPAGQYSTRHVVVSMTAPEALAEEGKERQPLNVALVIDNSGSMCGAPLENAKKAASLIVEAMRPGDVLSLVSFESEAIVHLCGQPMNPSAKKTMLGAISELQSLGGTALGDGWIQGRISVERSVALAPNAMKRILLLTDGAGNVGNCEPSFLAEQASHALKDQIYTSAVGIGEGYFQEQIEALSSHGGGMLHDAQHPHEIVEVVMGEFGDMSRIWAENLRIRVAVPNRGVGCSVLGTFPSELVYGDQGLEYEISAGMLMSGSTRELVLRLDFADMRAGKKLNMPIQVLYRHQGSSTDQKVEVGVTFDVQANTFDFASEPALDSTFAHTVADAWIAWLSQKATALNRSGDLETARFMIRNEAKALSEWVSGFDDASAYMKKLKAISVFGRTHVDERKRKEMYLQSIKHQKGERDYRNQVRLSSFDSILADYGDES